MTTQKAQPKLQQATCSAIVTRADGTVEDHGVIAYWHRNPMKRLWWRVRHGGKGRVDV